VTNRFTTLLLAAMLALALAACTATPEATGDAGEPTEAAESEPAESEPAETSAAEESEEAEADEARVRIDGSAFDPEELTVPVGTEVQFVNADNFEHTVTEGTDGQPVDDPIVDEEIAQNGTVSVTFDEAGTYEITCQIHPSMHMTVTVEG
jgi:plastocyanin